MELQSLISGSELFRGVSPETAALAARRAVLRKHRAGETLTEKEAHLCLILSGSVRVVGTAREKALPLNTLRPGDFFGAASLFGGACGITSVTAPEESVTALFSQETVEELLRADFAFTRNYIAFLTRKICFLNRKIAGFTAGSAEKKLADYLLSLPAREGAVTLPMSMVHLAGALDLGRASLYRAFDALSEDGLIARSGNTVTICSEQELRHLAGGSI